MEIINIIFDFCTGGSFVIVLANCACWLHRPTAPTALTPFRALRRRKAGDGVIFLYSSTNGSVILDCINANNGIDLSH